MYAYLFVSLELAIDAHESEEFKEAIKDIARYSVGVCGPKKPQGSRDIYLGFYGPFEKMKETAEKLRKIAKEIGFSESRVLGYRSLPEGFECLSDIRNMFSDPDCPICHILRALDLV